MSAKHFLAAALLLAVIAVHGPKESVGMELYVAAAEKEEMATNILWAEHSPKLSPRRWLLLVQGDEVVLFQGKSMRGFAWIKDMQFRYYYPELVSVTFALQLTDGVRHIAGRDGQNGSFMEGLASAVGTTVPTTWAEAAKVPTTWAEVARDIGVSVPSAMEFLRAWDSEAAARLDEFEWDLT